MFKLNIRINKFKLTFEKYGAKAGVKIVLSPNLCITTDEFAKSECEWYGKHLTLEWVPI